MYRYALFTVVVIAAGCAHIGGTTNESAERLTLWADALDALEEQQFARSEREFRRLATQHPGTAEGHEALFYLGALRLDPNNPLWDPRPAEEALQDYLAAPASEDTLAHEREASILLALAEQLAAAPEERVPALRRSTTRSADTEPHPADLPQEGPTAEECVDSAAVEELRREIAEKEAEISSQNEELERIRRTLTPRPPV